ncbi:YtzH-like family protein [Alteribacter populi]|uniref:YtzH-like family protein n=1 Tax=Alteribacter populi TaxID=2011011 RepID=UPI000BBB3AB2|nr:YtzH-like family protein [Alteribacter populi]
MSMNYHHQLQLLVDILKNQDTEHFGSKDEYAQLERLARSLLKNTEVQEEVKTLLTTIEQYSHEHQADGTFNALNSEEIQQWVQGIERSEHNYLHPNRLM